jgi:hypothetical protein
MQNPFALPLLRREPRVPSRWLTFRRDFADGTINILLSSLLCSAVASKAIAGRETVVRALQGYFDAHGHLSGSPLMKARYASLKNSIPDPDIARFEAVGGIAILGNTVPTGFWTIFHIFSNPVVLEQVRRQVEDITSPPDMWGVRKISLRKLKDAPIISSATHEALRHRNTGIGPRMIMEDVTIGGSLLKKGSVVIIAQKALHTNREEWGDNAQKFKADRFIGKVPAQAFRGFGGGANMCPGKTFALGELGALIAMLVMRFDLQPIDGKWEEPGQNLTNMSIQVAPPERHPMVSFIPRAGAKDFVWEFEL